MLAKLARAWDAAPIGGRYTAVERGEIASTAEWNGVVEPLF
jgi:hypothetical protein